MHLCIEDWRNTHLVTRLRLVHLQNSVLAKGVWESNKNTLGFAGSSSPDDGEGMLSEARGEQVERSVFTRIEGNTAYRIIRG